MTDEPRKAPRLIDAMPRPLGILFAAAATVALAFAIIGLLKPPTPPVALQDRRPPPVGSYTHNVGTIEPLPLPSVVPTLPAACDAVSTTKIEGSGDAVLRIRTALDSLCTLAHGGVSADVSTGIGGLRGATIRFAGFARTGVDSTADLDSRIVWLNSRFALRKVPELNLAPLILHEAYHLGSLRIPEHENTSFVNEEFFARKSEVEACRALIDIRRWPPGCKDARDLTSMSFDAFSRLLVNAGYSDSPIGLGRS